MHCIEDQAGVDEVFKGFSVRVACQRVCVFWEKWSEQWLYRIVSSDCSKDWEISRMLTPPRCLGRLLIKRTIPCESGGRLDDSSGSGITSISMSASSASFSSPPFVKSSCGDAKRSLKSCQ